MKGVGFMKLNFTGKKHGNNRCTPRCNKEKAREIRQILPKRI